MVNEIWDDKYEILSKLGSGGSSMVYKARRLADDQVVAIKIIRDDLENVKESERYFRLEAEALSKMSHRNIRHILNVGEWNGTLYMVTEYVDGQTLKDLFKDGPLSQKKALDYALQIAAGLEHAHRKNIIHRDIKPQNVLIAHDGTAKIADFGIARMTTQTTRTMAGKDVIGSVHYLSPEQAAGETVDARTDIYSFGVLMYEMFVGHVPFEGDEAVAVAMKHIRQEPEEPCRANPSLEKGLSDLILKCMAKKPEARYQNVTELREDLLLYAANPKAFTVARNETSAEENDPLDVPRRRTQNAENGDKAVRKRVTYYNEEQHERIRREKTRRVIGITVGVLASAAVIVLALTLTLPAILPGQTYEQRAIPAVASFSRSAATAILRGETFSKFTFKDEYSTAVEEGKVVRTEPEEGTLVPVNTEITVYLSKGAPLVMAVNTVGQTEEEAKAALREQGLEVSIEYVTDESKPSGTVLEQANTTREVPVGSIIKLKVVRNVKSVYLEVPDLKGLSLEAAREAILKAGFQVGTIREEKVDDGAALGVNWQDKEAGRKYYYLEGDKAPEVEISFTVNVSSGYKCVYDYATPTGEMKDMELLVYDAEGTEVMRRLFNGTNQVTLEYSSTREETLLFELYENNILLDQRTLQTSMNKGE